MFGGSKIFEAIRNNNISKVKELLKQKPKLANATAKESTPLSLSITLADCTDEITKLLLDNGANVNNRDVLVSVALSKDEKKISMVMDAMDIDAKDEDGNTALHIMVGHDSNLVETLLDKGADVNTKNYEGETPLHTAAISDMPFCILALIENGSDINACNNRGVTPLGITYFNGFPKSEALLTSLGAKFSEGDKKLMGA